VKPAESLDFQGFLVFSYGRNGFVNLQTITYD